MQKMFKFKGTKSQQSSTESVKSVEEYFAFSKVATLGFPNKPTALAWDPYLCLLGIGSQYGYLRIYGAPGVMFCAELKQRICIVDLIFVPKKARLISLCTDNSLHLWELNEKNGVWILEEMKSFILNGMMKKITTIFLNSTSEILYLGTMCGNIYTLNVETFEMAESVIYQDVVVQNISDEKKLKQGAVKVISSQPNNPDCLLIGYQYGLIALWDIKRLIVNSTFISSQNLESVAWHHSGIQFMSSYSDGSYVTWSTLDPSKPVEVPMNPYGPFACKSIEKLLWKTAKGGDDFIIFSGGMPKSSYGDKFTVTIMCGDQHQVLDLSSKVIDFFTISEVYDESDFDNPHSLIILLEEELIAIDLESESWLPLKFPYLQILHSSPITCFQYCPDVHKDMWKQLQNLSQKDYPDKFSEADWPVKGGKCISDNNLVNNNILVTGHENGHIKIWNATYSSLQLIYSFDTTEVFITYDGDEESDDAIEEWPPFRKVGSFDPLSDDQRLAIKKIVLNDTSRTLIAGGNAGQIITLQLLDLESEKETIVTHVTIGDKWENTLWCNPQPLIVKHGKRKYEEGFHVQCVVQVTPPAPITALAFHAEWNLIAAGIIHGFLVYDIVQKKCVMSRYTMNIAENFATVGSISPKSRSSSLKKSFRESFRKLKITKTKSLKRERAGSLSSDIQEVSRENSIKRESFASSPDPTLASSPSPELNSFNTDTESQSADDIMNSVQCLYFAQSFIINNVITTPTLWVGTSSGSVYIYTITMPASDCRTSDLVVCQLGKEVQLKHQAPILGIQIVDHRGYPLPDPTDVQYQRTKPADLCGTHKVVICTEEQIKVFNLPTMKPFCKNKISLIEGYHISKVGFVVFPSKIDLKLSENCAVCLSNSNGITLYSTPDIKRIISFNYLPLEDINILSKTYFSSNGLLVCLISPSEFEIISLSTSVTTKAFGKIELPENARLPVKSLENIVLDMQHIPLQNGHENPSQHSFSDTGNSHMQNAQSIVDESSRLERLSLSSERMLNENDESSSFDAHDSSSASHSNTFQEDNRQSQAKRAPLATIDELNLSDESQLNVSCNSLQNNGFNL